MKFLLVFVFEWGRCSQKLISSLNVVIVTSLPDCIGLDSPIEKIKAPKGLIN